MRRRRYYILGALLLAGVLAFWIFSPTAGPSYDGRTLSEWLDFRGKLRKPPVNPIAEARDHEVFTNAIAHMGTNTIPFLLESAQFQVKPWQTATHNYLYKHWPNGIVTRRFGNWISLHNQRRQPATKALASLGPRAESAIPALISCLDSNIFFTSQILAGIGEKSARPLVLALTNAAALPGIISSLELLGTNALPALPLLIQNLQSTNAQLAERSAAVLRRISPSVRPLPELKDLAKDPRPQFRRGRLNAIRMLADYNGRDVRALLTEALEDPDAAVQTAASNSLRTLDLFYGKPQSVSNSVSGLVSPTNK